MSADRSYITELSSEERRLIELMRELQYGELIISMQQGVPIRAELRRSVLLSDGKRATVK